MAKINDGPGTAMNRIVSMKTLRMIIEGGVRKANGGGWVGGLVRLGLRGGQVEWVGWVILLVDRI